MSFTNFMNDPSLNGGSSLQDMIESDMETDIVTTGNTLYFQGTSRPDMITDSVSDKYAPFSNLEDFKDPAYAVVNPNNVMPLHHPLEVS